MNKCEFFFTIIIIYLFFFWYIYLRTILGLKIKYPTWTLHVGRPLQPESKDIKKTWWNSIENHSTENIKTCKVAFLRVNDSAFIHIYQNNFYLYTHSHANLPSNMSSIVLKYVPDVYNKSSSLKTSCLYR